MGKFKFIETRMQGLYVIEPKAFEDARGFFMETYNAKIFHEAGLVMNFVQDNESFSKKGVLRGLHFQYQYPQGKLVWVTSGEIFDVAVDLRKKSKTYGKWFGIVLSSNNKKQIYIPKGFAHGFLVLSEEAHIKYKCSDYYHPEDEGGILWNDPEIGIDWPLDITEQVFLSPKDEKWKTLKETIANF